MKIGIEAQRIFRKKKGGMDVAALEIIKSLQLVDVKNEYIIYASPGTDDTPIISETDNFKIKYIKGLSYVDWEQISLPIQAEKDKVDILHSTSNTAPLWGDFLKVITVHDIMYLEKKGWSGNAGWYQQLGNYYRKYIVPPGIKSADHILAVSNFEKENILKYFSSNRLTIDVVSNGVSKVFMKIIDQEVLKKVLKKYALPERFIFFLGNTEPRKNMQNFLKAYSSLSMQSMDLPALVITNITSEYLDKQLEEIKCPSLSSKIILTGYVDFKDLPVLYNLAEFYVYPSLREGFGLPILEAMACGTAVITSNISSMPEIAGDAAILVDPYSPESIAEGMMQFLSDRILKEEKICKGMERYRQYTWGASAKKLMGIYELVKEKQYSKRKDLVLQ